MSSGTQLSPPREFDGYELIRRLGKGGMGEVHKALDTLLDRYVAIKFITSARADEIARTRFLLEARAFARLQHPNVVSIYRVGEVNGFPYLVSEYVQGKPLDGFSFRRTSINRIIQIASGIARGLAAAHKQGVIHRDIKPGNIMVTDSGEAKILDFGIAKLLESMSNTTSPSKPVWEFMEYLPAEMLDDDTDDILDNSIRYEPVREKGSTEEVDALMADDTPIHEKELTRPGTAIGTPRYMAPEVWRGKEATFRSDVYSFGALLFFLCSGESPHNGKTAKEIGRKCVTSDAPLLQTVVPGIHPGLAAVVNKCLKRNPIKRYASGNEIRMAIAQLTPEMRTEVSPEGNPYRGLHPFEAEHRNLFFGRDSEIRLILERLKSEPLVVVAGDSGIGKSSLCRAGIIPRVESWFSDSRKWRSMTIIPGPHPVISFSASLSVFIQESEKEIEEAIRHEPANIARMLRAASGPEGGLLIFIDQLEELVTLSDPKEAEAIAELLKWLSISTPGVRLLATVRGDFLSNVATLPQLSEQISTALFFVRPMTSDRITEAVVGPANVKGISFESDDLVVDLVNATVNADGGLPLLQFTLRELWEARKRDVISMSTLEAIGGVDGALSRHADNVYDQLPPQTREAARQIILQLVTAQKTRARKSIDELNPENRKEFRDAIHYLTRGRLIVARETVEGTIYEIAHESLITGWSTLTTWLSADTESALIHERLQRAAEEWERLNYANDALWKKIYLDESRLLKERNLNDLSLRFLRASRRAYYLRTVIIWLVIVCIPLAVFIMLSGRTFTQKPQESFLGHAEIKAAREVLERIQQHTGNLRATRKQAFKLFRTRRISEAEQQWQKYLKQIKPLEKWYAEAARHLESALLQAQNGSALKKLYARILYERALLAQETHSADPLIEYLNRLQIYDEGEYLRQWNSPATVSFHVAHGEQVRDVRVDVTRQLVDESGMVSSEKLGTLRNQTERMKLQPGSYLATVFSEGGALVSYPFVLTRAQKMQIAFALPENSAVPDGMIYIPPGNFYWGSTDSEELRKNVFHTVPAQLVATPGYLIGRKEVTYEQWLTFLEDVTSPDDAVMMNENLVFTTDDEDSEAVPPVMLRPTAEGEWLLQLNLPTQKVVAVEGQPVTFSAGKNVVQMDWLQMPVTGITSAEAQRYAQWLDESDQVTGARLCSEWEWERAAKGADRRLFPHGEVSDSDNADSPFGIQDMAGTAWEWTHSVLEDGFVLRGGDINALSMQRRVVNRRIPDPKLRDIAVGFRICTDF
jgi:eukaryotic-like serine/threonine-protein kinase